ncbi:MAG TPA: hypothetical protein ENN13_01220 [Candidatus Altiarchaeales archaeon]|nr:hypothetical protein [Candidatus Altiarchaeales archaeon]
MPASKNAGGGIQKPATSSDYVKKAMMDYVRFSVKNVDAAGLMEHLNRSLENDDRVYGHSDSLFLSINISSFKHLKGFMDVKHGPGIGWILLKSAGLNDSSIISASEILPELVDEASSIVRAESQAMSERLPGVKCSGKKLPKTEHYEVKVKPSFFEYLGPDGVKSMRQILKGVFNPKEDDIVVQHLPTPTGSKRTVDRILVVGRSGGNLKSTLLVKAPNNQLEPNASTYAGGRLVEYGGVKKTLGPRALLAGDYIIEDDAKVGGSDLRSCGHVFTEAEASAFGRQMALDLIAMCKDRRFLYQTQNPAARIIVSGIGKNLVTQRLDWSDSADISAVRPKKFRDLITTAVHGDAFIIRGELLRLVDSVAWASYSATLTDKDIVGDDKLTSIFGESIRKVKENLTNPNYQINGVPIGEDSARRWKSVFKESAAKMPLSHSTTKEIGEAIKREGGILHVVKRSLKWDLVRSEILAPEVAGALIEDLIHRVKIQDYLEIPHSKFLEITDSQMKKTGLPKKRREKIAQGLSSGIGGGKILSFKDVGGLLSKQLAEAGIEDNTAKAICSGVKDEIDGLMASKISFTEAEGEVSWLRPWAKHILVHGPEPERRILAVYRFKPTHGISERDASLTASEEGLGPKIVWSYRDDKDGREFLLEEYIQSISPDGLGPVEIVKLARETGQGIYRMFSLYRHKASGKAIHSFDGFERGHFQIRRVGDSLKPVYIDYGEPSHLDHKNRSMLLEWQLEPIFQEIRGWPHPELAWASFESTLEKRAGRLLDVDEEYGRQISYALGKIRDNFNRRAGPRLKSLQDMRERHRRNGTQCSSVLIEELDSAERDLTFFEEVDEEKRKMP